MGSWNETCALSNLAIRYYEPTVLVCLNPKHALRGEPQRERFGYDEFDYKAVLGIYKGPYDDYGSVEGVDTETIWNVPEPDAAELAAYETQHLNSIQTMTRMALGEVEGERSRQQNLRHQWAQWHTPLRILFHQGIWDRAVAYIAPKGTDQIFKREQEEETIWLSLSKALTEAEGRTEIERIMRSPIPFEMPFIRELYCVAVFATLVRRDLLSARVTAHQEEDAGLKAQRFLHREIGARLNPPRGEKS